MDVREKLVELIEKASYECDEGTRDLYDMREVADGIADFLIAHGVTAQEWISVRNKLPDQSGEVLVIVSGNPQKNITLNCAYELAEYDPYGGWIMEMWPEWEDAVVTHWMPLPPPPKGE